MGIEEITKNESQHLVLTFKNDSKKEMLVVVDPPCEKFRVNIGEMLKLMVFDYKLTNTNVSDIVDIRYESDCINIDVNYNLKLGVEFEGSFRVIWDTQ